MVAHTTIVEALPAAVPFVGPETLERERHESFSVRLGANESAFGISSNAAAAMKAAMQQAAWYGDPEGFDLRTALATEHNVRLDQVCLGAGIDELLGVLVRMTVVQGSPVVTSLGAYPTFNYHVAGVGGRLISVPYRDDAEDLGALLAAVKRERAQLVYLSNPDNPMGTWHTGSDIEAFVRALPDSTLLLLDEAYAEFAPSDAIPRIDPDEPKVVRLRTFSKAHGMAGLRVGFALADARNITGLGKIRNHFGVNRIAQAGAFASLADRDFVNWVVREVARGREEYYQLAADLGLKAVTSATNFVAIDMGGDGDKARATLRALQEQGVFIRMPGVAPLDRCIRVTVGTADQRVRFAQIFRRLVTAN